jgi:hypothetical protein
MVVFDCFRKIDQIVRHPMADAVTRSKSIERRDQTSAVARYFNRAGVNWRCSAASDGGLMSS